MGMDTGGGGLTAAERADLHRKDLARRLAKERKIKLAAGTRKIDRSPIKCVVSTKDGPEVYTFTGAPYKESNGKYYIPMLNPEGRAFLAELGPGGKIYKGGRLHTRQNRALQEVGGIDGLILHFNPSVKLLKKPAAPAATSDKAAKEFKPGKVLVTDLEGDDAIALKIRDAIAQGKHLAIVIEEGDVSKRAQYIRKIIATELKNLKGVGKAKDFKFCLVPGERTDKKVIALQAGELQTGAIANHEIAMPVNTSEKELLQQWLQQAIEDRREINIHAIADIETLAKALAGLKAAGKSEKDIKDYIKIDLCGGPFNLGNKWDSKPEVMKSLFLADVRLFESVWALGERNNYLLENENGSLWRLQPPYVQEMINKWNWSLAYAPIVQEDARRLDALLKDDKSSPKDIVQEIKKQIAGKDLSRAGDIVWAISKLSEGDAVDFIRIARTKDQVTREQAALEFSNRDGVKKALGPGILGKLKKGVYSFNQCLRNDPASSHMSLAAKGKLQHGMMLEGVMEIQRAGDRNVINLVGTGEARGNRQAKASILVPKIKGWNASKIISAKNYIYNSDPKEKEILQNSELSRSAKEAELRKIGKDPADPKLADALTLTEGWRKLSYEIELRDMTPAVENSQDYKRLLDEINKQHTELAKIKAKLAENKSLNPKEKVELTCFLRLCGARILYDMDKHPSRKAELQQQLDKLYDMEFNTALANKDIAARLEQLAVSPKADPKKAAAPVVSPKADPKKASAPIVSPKADPQKAAAPVVSPKADPKKDAAPKKDAVHKHAERRETSLGKRAKKLQQERDAITSIPSKGEEKQAKNVLFARDAKKKDERLGEVSAFDVTVEEFAASFEQELNKGCAAEEYSVSVYEEPTKVGFDVFHKDHGDEALLHVKEQGDKFLLSGETSAAAKQYNIMKGLIAKYKQENAGELPEYVLPRDCNKESVAGMLVAAIESGVEIKTHDGKPATDTKLQQVLQNLPEGITDKLSSRPEIKDIVAAFKDELDSGPAQFGSFKKK